MLSFNNLGNLGRLGNQMFQYAALRGIATKFGYDYCLPPDNYIGVEDSNVRNSDITLFECFKIPDAPRLYTNLPTKKEPYHALDKDIWYNCPDNINLYGFYQTEIYFRDIESDIRNAFIFVEDIKQPCEEYFYNNFKDTKVISLHVRRGDYLDSDHWTPLKGDRFFQYYKKALSYFDNDIPVMVFSDGIEWCKKQELFTGDRFSFSDSKSTGIDLCLQSLCNYHIIATSSFSWWGSWLAKSEKTIVPKNWFGENKPYINGLYLKDWKII